MPDTMIRKGYREILLSAVSTVLTGNSGGWNIPNVCDDFLIWIVGAGTISAGTMVIEEGPYPDYAGDWSQIGDDIDLTDVTSDAALAIHINGLINCIRVRMTVDISGGGNVTVFLTGR